MSTTHSVISGVQSPVATLPPPGSALSRVGILSTFPPKICGLATFAAALAKSMAAYGITVDVAQVSNSESALPLSPSVVGELINGSAVSLASTAKVLSQCDVAIIQHEYGIFGGPDGDEVLDLIEALTIPTVVVLHTVPLHPTRRQRQVLAAVCQVATRAVVMTNIAYNRLVASYPVDRSKVSVIVHGAQHRTASTNSDNIGAPQLLTWGLLGPGKGIEHVIDALGLLTDLHPRPRYTVAGVTHPNVAARHGDDYRNALMRRARLVNVASQITFDNTYRNVDELTDFVSSAEVVILPYDSRDQVTSGVLVDAIAAGKPVIATAFPHATELLASGAGIVVPHGDPAALAAAIRTMLCDDAERTRIVTEAERIAPMFAWSEVAAQYLSLCTDAMHSTSLPASEGTP